MAPVIGPANKSSTRRSIPSRAERRQAQLMIYGGFGLLAVLLILGICGLLLIMKPELVLPETAERPGGSGGSTVPGGGFSTAAPADRWADATVAELEHNGVKVRVDYVDVGDVATRNNANAVEVFTDRDYLHVTLSLENTNAAPVAYRSWQGNTFPGGSLAQVKLTDNSGAEYAQATFPGARSVKGHLADAQLDPKEKVTDTLIFQPRAGQDPRAATFYLLELPAGAHGAEGEYRFRIPRNMLEEAPSLGGPGSEGFTLPPDGMSSE
ncbi:hypothetical protein Pla8534_50610 [Lignipirellula cremea]|uniref:DUF4352 domain-containing protein n=2 Tax=Lignipirellula cremea TaxID=2528010 RepID=A0A518DZE4_9BACT|nr:hypothetical protein Pla8534_50610 [Lignipirellula cremea]